MLFDPKQYRLDYGKEKLKRVPLDIPIETEYKPLKEYCDKNGLKVNGLIRHLINREINYPGLHLLDIINEDQLTELSGILESKRNQTVTEWLKDSINKFIDKYSE